MLCGLCQAKKHECEATLKPLDFKFIQSPSADATPDPIEEPATTNLLGEEYFFFEEDVVEVVCQSHDTPTSEMSVTHHDGMELKESGDTLMSEASTSDVSDLDLQSEVWKVDNEVQEMPSFHNSSMDFHSESEVQRFNSMYTIGNLLGTGGFGSFYEGVCKSDGQPKTTQTVFGQRVMLQALDPDKLPVKDMLQIWDTAGQERFRTITQSYYRSTNGAIITYDITRKATFLAVPKWLDDVKKYGGSNIATLLIGNKSDLTDERDVTYEEAQTMAHQLDVISAIETSAKDSSNVDEAFNKMAAELMLRHGGPVFRDHVTDSFKLNSKDVSGDAWSCSSC
ncbi:Ras-related protein Rab-43 [Bagarius yarrelli]|uniref:Ras-related protein Rab-43 n=1 Tax=Bagarius yarrelli TaxID=175774 RepID=A0A556V5Z4_BAGYA|nr:Ras-related protein Rab-43 [Bagarius yarrelli]